MSNQSTANAKPRKSTEADAVLSVELSYMGFYCANNYYANLEEIDYKGHPSQIDDEDHLTLAGCLLRGVMPSVCAKIEEILGYIAFINEERNGKGTMYFAKLTWKAKLR